MCLEMLLSNGLSFIEMLFTHNNCKFLMCNHIGNYTEWCHKFPFRLMMKYCKSVNYYERCINTKFINPTRYKAPVTMSIKLLACLLYKAMPLILAKQSVSLAFPGKGAPSVALLYCRVHSICQLIKGTYHFSLHLGCM